MRGFLAVVGIAAVGLSGGAHPQARAIGHADPGGGYSGDVYVQRGYAYLSSWHGSACPSQGVRVYDLRNPARPRRVATFADGRSELEVRGSWTEKTIVEHARTPSLTGDLAAGLPWRPPRRQLPALPGHELVPRLRPLRRHEPAPAEAALARPYGPRRLA